MRFLFKNKGASQTEYIIIVVLIAVSSMAAVSQYGKEIKALFQKTTAKLSLNNTNDDGDNKIPPGENREIGGGDTTIPDSGDTDIGVSDEKPSKSEEECRKEYDDLMREKTDREHRHNLLIGRSIARERHYRELANKYARLASRYNWFHTGSVSVNFQILGLIFGNHGHYGGENRQRDYYLKKARMYGELADREVEYRRRENENYNAFLENWNLKMEQWQNECGGRH